MEKMSTIKGLVPILLMAFVFTNCDMQESTVGTFEDTAEKLPNFSVIEGAEDVTVSVTRNNDVGYFDAVLTNVGNNPFVVDGSYTAWCAHWSAPIDSDGRKYDGVSLYSTQNDKNWNKLNYVLNERSGYYETIEGVTYKEIQAVIWTLIEFKEFDIEKNRIFSGLNKDAYYAVLSDAKENGDSFQSQPGDIHAVFANMSVLQTDGDNTQTVIIEVIAAGRAWGGDTIAGTDDFTWYYYNTNDDEVQGIYTIATNTRAGDVMISDPVDGTVTLTIELYNDGQVGWFYRPFDEVLFIKGYDDEAEVAGYVQPDQPWLYAGNDLVVEVDEYEFYAIYFQSLEKRRAQ